MTAGALTRALLRRPRAWVCVLLLVGVAWVTADVLMRGPLTQLDWATHRYVAQHVDGGWWWLFYVLSIPGMRPVLVVPLGVISVIAAIRHRSLRPMVVPALVCIWLAIVVPLFKIWTGRTAPGSGYDAVFAGGAEFPSGHVVNAIVIWGMFLELLVSVSRHAAAWLPVRTRRWLVVAATTASGIGMVGLDYHWLSDALAGWMLGVAMFIPLVALDPFRPLRAAAPGKEPAPGRDVPEPVPGRLRTGRPPPAS